MLNDILTRRLTLSFGSVNVSIGNPMFWIGVAAILLFFLVRWGLKKFITFSIIVGVSIFLMFKVDKFIIDFFGKEDGQFFTLLTKPFFIFVIGFVFIYYVFIDKD